MRLRGYHLKTRIEDYRTMITVCDDSNQELTYYRFYHTDKWSDSEMIDRTWKLALEQKFYPLTIF